MVAIKIDAQYAIAHSREASLELATQKKLLGEVLSPSGYSQEFSRSAETSYRIDVKLDQSTGMLRSSVYPNEVGAKEVVDVAEVEIPRSTLQEIMAAKDTEPAKAFSLLWPFFKAVFNAAQSVGQPILSARLMECIGEKGQKSNDEIIEELRALMTKLHRPQA